MKQAENIFEFILWESRRIILLPVVISILLGFGVLFVSTIDSVQLIGRFASYNDTSLDEKARDAVRLDTISKVIEIVDSYLLGAILLIFGLGLYELFINKIDRIEGSEVANRLLLIRSFDDLKDRLAKVVLLILIVKFFQIALELKYTTPNDLLVLAVSIALIGGALYLSNRH